MRQASDRARALKRIAAVQADMVKFADSKVARAQATRSRVVEEIGHLSSFTSGEGALGPTLTRAVLRTAKSLESQRIAAERDVDAALAVLQAAKRREHAAKALCEDAGRAARREAEGKALSDTLEAWLAGRSSLP